MATVTVQRTFAAPVGDVFDWLSTASNYTAAPGVLRARLVRPGAGAPYGRGAIREVISVLARFREEITAYDPPHEFRYIIRAAVPPVRHEGGSVVCREAPGGTEVTWTSTYTLAVPGADRIIAPVVRTAFAAILRAADKQLR